MEISIHTHVYLNINTDGHIEKHTHRGKYTHMHFLALSAKTTQKQGYPVATTALNAQVLVSNTLLQYKEPGLLEIWLF